jgi:hypothetical protein
MSSTEYPGELGRLGEDRVGGEHEAREVRRDVRARCGARIWYVFKNRSVAITPYAPRTSAARS